MMIACAYQNQSWIEHFTENKNSMLEKVLTIKLILVSYIILPRRSW